MSTNLTLIATVVKMKKFNDQEIHAKCLSANNYYYSRDDTSEHVRVPLTDQSGNRHMTKLP